MNGNSRTDESAWKQVKSCLYQPKYIRRFDVKLSMAEKKFGLMIDPWLVVSRIWPTSAQQINITEWGTVATQNSAVIVAVSTIVPIKYHFNEYQSLIHRKPAKCAMCKGEGGRYTEPNLVPLGMASMDYAELIRSIYDCDPADPELISWGNPRLDIHFDEAIQQINYDLIPIETWNDYLIRKNWLRSQLKRKQELLNSVNSTLLCASCLKKQLEEFKDRNPNELQDSVFRDFKIDEDEDEVVITHHKNALLRINDQRSNVPPESDRPDIAYKQPLVGMGTVRNRVYTYLQGDRLPPLLFLCYFLCAIVFTGINAIGELYRQEHDIIIDRPLCVVDEVEFLIRYPYASALDYHTEMEQCAVFDETDTNPDAPSHPDNLCDSQPLCSYNFATRHFVHPFVVTMD